MPRQTQVEVGGVWPERAEWIPLLVVLSIFGLMCCWNINARETLIWDEAEYASLGRSIARGDGYQISGQSNSIRPPLWPASIAAVMTATGSQGIGAAKATTILYALLAIVVVYWVVWLECGVGPAIVAACSLALSPEFVVGSVMLLSEIPFMALHAAALAAFYVAFQRGGVWFYAGWTCFALALSVRYTALLFGPILILVFVYEWTRDRGNIERLLRTRAFWLAPLVAVAILGPWYVRQWLVSGDALIGVSYASQQIPTYSIASMPWYFYLVGMLPAMTPAIALAAMGSLIHGAMFSRRRLVVYALFGVLVIVGWHMTYDYKEFRLVSASLPMLAIALGVTVRSWMDWRPRGSALRWSAPAAVLILGLTLSVLIAGGRLRNGLALGEPSFLDAMAFLRASAADDAVLVAENQAQVHWYADRHTLRTPKQEEDFRQLLDEADWVIITSFERGQPDYLFPLTERAEMADTIRGDVKLFRDARFHTMLFRAEWVRAHMAADR